MMTTENHIAIGTNPDTLKPYSVMIVDDAAIDRSLLRRFCNRKSLTFFMKQRPEMIFISS